MNLSFWEKDSFYSQVDVLIVGSGLVGLNAAIHLKEQAPNLNVLVVERGTLPSGASTKNAGFACFGSISELLDDLQTHDSDEVFALVEKRWRGLQRLRQRVGDTNLSYEGNGNFELFQKEDATLYEQCIEKMDWFNHHLASITGLTHTFQIRNEQISQLGFEGFEHLILNTGEGQLHPGKMMKALLNIAFDKGVKFLFGNRVTQMESEGSNWSVSLENGQTIKTNKLLIATNGFAKQLLPELNVLPARNQVLLTTPIPNLKMKGCFHYEKGYVYFRNVGQRVLLGGGRHLDKTGETTDQFGHTQQIVDYLRTLLQKHILPTQPFEIEHQWSGILGVGQQKKPIIKEVKPNLIVAVRMGGMGVAIGSLVGEEAADLVL